VDVTYHRREQTAETRALAELLIERFVAHHRNVDRGPEVYVWHAKLLEERGRWDEAAARLDQAIALGIDDRTARGFTGRLETLRRKAKRAHGLSVEPAPPRRPAWVPAPHKDAVRLSTLPIGDATHRDLGSGAGFSLGVVGESYRQAALHALDAGRLQRGEHVTFTATLIPEALYDPNGIRVEIQGGAHVGYLSKEDAVWYRPVFAALAAKQLVGVVRAKLIGGVLPDKPSIGVMLDIHEPTELLRILATDSQPF
jgi:hypothetical protein